FRLDTSNNAFGSAAFPLPNVPQTLPSVTINDGDALGPILFDTRFRNSSTNSWNLGVQHELPGNNTIDVSYIGSKGTHIYRSMDGNPPDPAPSLEIYPSMLLPITLCSNLCTTVRSGTRFTTRSRRSLPIE